MCLLFSVRLKVTFSFVRINSCLKICCWLNSGTQLPKKTPSSIPWSFQMLHSVKYLQLYSFQTANCVTFSQRRTDRLKSYLPIRYSKFLHRIVQNAYKMFIHKNLGKRRKVEHRCICLSLHSIFPENCPLIPDQMVAALTCNPQVRWSWVWFLTRKSQLSRSKCCHKDCGWTVCVSVFLSLPELCLWHCSATWELRHWWWWSHRACSHMTDHCYCSRGDSPCSPASPTWKATRYA